MKQRELDKLARGPNPRDRVPVPKPGERCPRCHETFGSIRGELALDPAGAVTIALRQKPCLLCAPHLVPQDFR